MHELRRWLCILLQWRISTQHWQHDNHSATKTGIRLRPFWHQHAPNTDTRYASDASSTSATISTCSTDLRHVLAEITTCLLVLDDLRNAESHKEFLEIAFAVFHVSQDAFQSHPPVYPICSCCFVSCSRQSTQQLRLE